MPKIEILDTLNRMAAVVKDELLKRGAKNVRVDIKTPIGADGTTITANANGKANTVSFARKEIDDCINGGLTLAVQVKLNALIEGV